jgi:hypothetical protein
MDVAARQFGFGQHEMIDATNAKYDIADAG